MMQVSHSLCVSSLKPQLLEEGSKIKKKISKMVLLSFSKFFCILKWQEMQSENDINDTLPI